MKKRLKQIKSIASAVMTISSIVVMILALCAVDIKELSWTPFVSFFAAYAWLVYVARKIWKRGAEQ